MKNVHVLPTEKPSRLVLETVNDSLFLTTTTDFGTNIMKFQNIYITSDEVIKEGDYVFNLTSRYVYSITELWEIVSYERKIILTTDQDLINDGIRAIDDEFLNWFIKNPTCEEIKVEKWTDYKLENGNEIPFFSYKIIIPKEEQKQHLIDIMKADEELGLYEHGQEVGHNVQVEETLEEAAEKYVENFAMSVKTDREIGFIAGANWQQEKLLKFINDEDNHTEGELGNSCIDVQSLIYFMGQFKK